MTCKSVRRSISTKVKKKKIRHPSKTDWAFLSIKGDKVSTYTNCLFDKQVLHN